MYPACFGSRTLCEGVSGSYIVNGNGWNLDPACFVSNSLIIYASMFCSATTPCENRRGQKVEGENREHVMRCVMVMNGDGGITGSCRLKGWVVIMHVYSYDANAVGSLEIWGGWR